MSIAAEELLEPISTELVEFERRLAAVVYVYLLSVLPEQVAKDETNVLLVFDHQDTSHGSLLNSCVRM